MINMLKEDLKNTTDIFDYQMKEMIFEEEITYGKPLQADNLQKQKVLSSQTIESKSDYADSLSGWGQPHGPYEENRHCKIHNLVFSN